jgi:hypothetical protein
MIDPERTSMELNSESAVSASEGRKPYRKPSFRFEQVFETLALQCGKIQGTGGACNTVKIAS